MGSPRKNRTALFRTSNSPETSGLVPARITPRGVRRVVPSVGHAIASAYSCELRCCRLVIRSVPEMPNLGVELQQVCASQFVRHGNPSDRPKCNACVNRSDKDTLRWFMDTENISRPRDFEETFDVLF